jgi:hypothetical protein
VKLLVWDIQQGGGSRRRQRIIDSIKSHSPNIVALIEFIPNTARPLLQPLREAGFEHQICTKRNGFYSALRALLKIPSLWLETIVPAHGFHFGVIHAPVDPHTRTKTFLSVLVRVAIRRVGDPFLLIGPIPVSKSPKCRPCRAYLQKSSNWEELPYRPWLYVAVFDATDSRLPLLA